MANRRHRFRRAKLVFADIEAAVHKFTVGVVEKAIRIEATAMYGAFVASIPGETCITQHNATVRLDGYSGAVTGIVLRNSRGAVAPLIEFSPVHKVPSSQVGLTKHRLSKAAAPSIPDNVQVKVVVHRGAGRRIIDSGKKSVKITFTTTRTAYDEPLMRLYMPQLHVPMGDYDVVSYQYENFANSYALLFTSQYWARLPKAVAGSVDTVPF